MTGPADFDEELVTTAIRIPRSLHTRLKIAAAERVLPMNHLALVAIADFLERLIPASELKLTRDV